MHIRQVTGAAHLHVRTRARADVPLFRISETAGPIALKFGVLLGSHEIGVLQTSRLGYSCTCEHAHVQMCHFPYLRNGWTDCAEIWCVVCDPLAKRFAIV